MTVLLRTLGLVLLLALALAPADPAGAATPKQIDIAIQRGIGFLKFLLSRERDIDAFCLGRHRTRRSPAIEVYPKGVMRPDSRRTRRKLLS